MEGIVRLGETLDAAVVGERGVRLGKLAKRGVRVAEGFVVPRGVLLEDGLTNRLALAFDELGARSVIVRGGEMGDEDEATLKYIDKQSLVAAIGRLRRQSSNAAVIFQRTLNAELSGTILTMNPETSNNQELWLESYWWLGESVIFESKKPEVMLLEKNSGTVIMHEDGDEPTGLSEQHLEDLQEASLATEHLMGWPSKIDWAFENGVLYILDVRKLKLLEEEKW